jgi:ABC-type sugar transport system permease subunit
MTKTEETTGEWSDRASGSQQRKPQTFFAKRKYKGYLWILPAALLLLLFSYIPPVYAIVYSFTDWGIFQNVSFIGLGNYTDAFRDKMFWDSFLNAILFTASGILLGNIAAVSLAEMLFNMKNERVSACFRYLFMLSSIVPGVVSILVWEKIIFLPESSSLVGVANSLLHLVGLKGSEWYSSSSTIKLSIILTGFPFMGGTSFLIYLAGLQGINPEVIEASKLDGLSSWGRVLYIDLPLMKGQIKYFALTGVIGGLQNYNMQLILQNGSAASVPGYYIYKYGIEYSEMGYACALGMIMFVIILAITILNNILIKTKEADA